MEKTTYHHGNLRDQMIKNGVLLLNKYGTEGFSLRKVAAACGVSQTATYKHFSNKEDLINAISSKVLADFELALQDIVDEYKQNPIQQTLALGKRYVQFMVENPEHMKFIFSSNAVKTISYENHAFNPSENKAFEIFKQSATQMLNIVGIAKEEQGIKILTMWTVVHGLAMLLGKQTISLDMDYSQMVETILTEHLKLQSI